MPPLPGLQTRQNGRPDGGWATASGAILFEELVTLMD